MTWQMEGACSTPDGPAANFFSRGRSGLEFVQRMCADCPVRERCLREGMREEFGVWGGTSKIAREQTARAVLQPALTETPDGFQASVRYKPRADGDWVFFTETHASREFMASRLGVLFYAARRRHAWTDEEATEAKETAA